MTQPYQALKNGNTVLAISEFVFVFVIGFVLEVRPVIFAQERSSDRTIISIPSVAISTLTAAKTNWNSASKDPFDLRFESNVWFDELKQRMNSTDQEWTDIEATIVYQQLYRAVATGKFPMKTAQSVAKNLWHPLKFTLQSKVSKTHPTVGWLAGTYAMATSNHFNIATQGSTKQALEIAKFCEQTFLIWQQLFFSTWSSPEQLRKSLAQQQSLTSPTDERFQIVLFRNREGYVKQLQQIEPNVGVSTGYYSPKLRTVFCYWDDATSIPTLRHELTHQFFSQASRHPVESPENLKSDFWIIEGLALYMESIQIWPGVEYDSAIIGGWDAARLQPARYRRLHDETWIPWNEFRKSNNEHFRSGVDIKLWYSQAAGLTHFWMDGSSDLRSQFLDYAKSVYQGSPNPELLKLAQQDDNLRSAYDEFLQQPANRSSAFSPSPDIKDIVLSRCEVTTQQLLEWPESKRTLEWLDLSFSNIDDQLFVAPMRSNGTKLWDLRRLNVESTAITDASLPAIAKMPRLEELDLSHCAISDQGFESFRNHKSIKTLWLTGNEGISDRTLDVLSSLPKLEMVDLSQTAVTEEGWNRLHSKSPRLRRR